MITDLDAHRFVPPRQRDIDRGRARGKLHRIGHQVGQHLGDAVSVDVHQHGLVGRVQLQGDAMLAGKTFIGCQRLLQQRLQRHHLKRQAHLARFDFFTVQNIVDQPDQAFAIVLGDVHQVADCLRHGSSHATGNQPQRAANRGQRRAQLVTDG